MITKITLCMSAGALYSLGYAIPFPYDVLALVVSGIFVVLFKLV